MPGHNETRMLERRISNNRSDLDGDQKINYFLSWFNQWSDLQKSDFVNVLAERMSSTANGSYHDPSDSMNSMSLGAGDKKPPSLFDCQVKLFREWFLGWSDDQKNYLVIRLRDIDSVFFTKFEDRMGSGGRTPPEKDYFEPGVPDDLVRPSHTDQDSGVFNSSVHAKLVEVSEDEDINDEKVSGQLIYEAEVRDEEEEVQSADEEEQQIVDDEKSYPRKNSAGVNSYDNGIGLDTISEDSCHNDDDDNDST